MQWPIKVYLRRLRNKLHVTTNFYFLPGSNWQWFAFGLVIDCFSEHFSIRLGRLMFEVNFRPWLNPHWFEPPPGLGAVPIIPDPILPAGGAVMIGADWARRGKDKTVLGYYDVNKREFIVTHPDRIIPITLEGTDE
jgi:hypothetical protein